LSQSTTRSHDLNGQADGRCSVRLSPVSAYKQQPRHREASSEDLRGRDVDGIEGSNGVCPDERLGCRQDVGSDGD
jgi:hypothetical protein